MTTVAVEELLVLQTKLKDFIQNELLPYEQNNQLNAEDDIPMEAIHWVRKRSKELGFYGINLPKKYGGQDISLKGLCLCKEELARSGAVLWGQVLGEIGGPLRIGQMLENFTPEQIEKYVVPVITGETSCCFALTEPNAGSDAFAIQTTAVRDGDDYVLNGKKHFISAAPYADFAIVIAKELVECEKPRITAFIVDKMTSENPGFELGNIQVPISGERIHAELLFNQCRVPASNIIGAPGKGLLLGLKRINTNRVSHAAGFIGMAQHLLDLAVEQAKTRVQFGQPIGDFQAIQHMLAEMATEIYAARCMVYDVIEKIDRGEEDRAGASMAKLFASEVNNRVADKAIQIFGSQGLVKGHPVEKMYRSSRMYRILTGTSEIQKNTIAKELLKV
ncbi:alkylation response protein AidB-like acyl-CoA dehydrogenase [Bacillus niacini]|uniref:Alkylation response protein AidB-like acyl-CoA dehydrogenase n=1 Tax=Neobacillus niacini TaxID=86668 RepID=A0A852TGG3_9BACI|nr:acyl-CoA dehydrogenase family protein [Neobacillus niacini]NYE07219.1 alkylation response protein AidB-like acyl-CoA dehydrogenase [Neobacillus niacini]